MGRSRLNKPRPGLTGEREGGSEEGREGEGKRKEKRGRRRERASVMGREEVKKRNEKLKSTEICWMKEEITARVVLYVFPGAM